MTNIGWRLCCQLLPATALPYSVRAASTIPVPYPAGDKADYNQIPLTTFKMQAWSKVCLSSAHWAASCTWCSLAHLPFCLRERSSTLLPGLNSLYLLFGDAKFGGWWWGTPIPGVLWCSAVPPTKSYFWKHRLLPGAISVSSILSRIALPDSTSGNDEYVLYLYCPML